MRHRFSIFLMTVSLALLAGFLILYLNKTWNDELENLQKETSYLFVNAIHGIEGDLLDKLILKRKPGKGDSTQATFMLRIPEPPPSGDSIQIVNFIGEENVEIQRDTAHFKVSLRQETTHRRHPAQPMSGSLSMIVALSAEGVADTIFTHPNASGVAVLPMLENKFGEAIEAAGLPLRHRILRWTSADSTPALDLPVRRLAPPATFVSGSYEDLSSGEKYAAELSGYRGYVFKKMLPEALFSLALFACVALAFFTVFKNLQAQRRLTELKNDFIRNVTHELKTPIATVSVAIEAMQDFDALRNPARTQEYLDISKNELNRLSLLVDKVLRMSLFEKAEPELKLEPLDLKSLVEEVLTSMKLQFEKAGARINFEAGDSPLGVGGGNFQLEGDRLHLASVVYNLLDNALKYSPVQPVVTVGLQQLDGHVYLRVADNGMGIPAEYKDKIFEKFFRIPTGDRHNVKGHGLGLSYVASVVQKHRGRIEMQSQPQAGTTFIIAFPNVQKQAA